MQQSFTVGVEEEYQIIDPETRSLRQRAEVILTDVCMSGDEAVMVAGLARALTRRCYEQALRNEAIPIVRPEPLRAAKWRAARYGLDASLVDVHEQTSRPALDVLEEWLTWLRPSLEANGDWAEIHVLVRQAIERGTGAARQRNAFGRRRRLEDVVDLIVSETGAS